MLICYLSFTQDSQLTNKLAVFLTIGKSSMSQNDSGKTYSIWKHLESPGFSAGDLRNIAKPEQLLQQAAPLMITQIFKLKGEKDFK